jgi:hypothetical protein
VAAKKSTKKTSKKSTTSKNENKAESSAQSTQQAGQSPQTQIIDPATISYNDGLAGISLYHAAAKIDFYRVVGMNPDGSEVRRISDRIVIPASKLVEVERAIQQIAQALQNAKQGADIKG